MPALGFKGPHTQETKDKISLSQKGKRPCGFNIKRECAHCKKQIAIPNLKRHENACKQYYEYKYIFKSDISLIQFKHFKNVIRLNYGLTLEEYSYMHKFQEGKCKICKKSPKQGKSLHIDHCHNSGKVRGLLCMNCNVLLGMCEENVEVLKKCIQYLEYKD